MAFSVVALAIQYKVQLLATLTLGYIAALCIYRRFFHPLAQIPGPFLPAVTKLYQSAYNGRYYVQVARLHEKYGLLPKQEGFPLRSILRFDPTYRARHPNHPGRNPP
jgi:hypothetical protein